MVAGTSGGGLARVAATVVLEPQAYASLRLEVVDGGGTPVAGVRAHLSGDRSEGEDFEATALSDGEGKLALVDVADACPLTLVVGGEGEWIAKSMNLAPLSAGEARDLGRCVLLRGRTLTGFVVDDVGGTVADARVTLSQPNSPLERRMNVGLAETSTSSNSTTGVDELGRFRFEAVAAGTYVLQASAPGYLGGRIEPLRVPDDAGSELELRLERGLVVHGRVIDENGLPVPDARVARLASSLALTAKSRAEIAAEDGVGVDPEGRFQLGGLRAEESVVLFAQAPGRAARVLPLEVAAEEVTCVLPLAHVLEARVLDQETEPVPEAFARIELLRSAGSEGGKGLVFDSEARSDASGRLELAGLVEGEYRLSLTSAAGHLERELAIPCPAQELQLARAEALTVRVIDANARPVADLRVELALPALHDTAAPTGDRILRARTDADGRAIYRDLLRGLWSVRVLREDAVLAEEALEVTSLPATVEVTALEPGSLIVHVVDGSERPVAGVPVRLTREGRSKGRRSAAPGGQDKVTDAFGRAAWVGVAAGEYLVAHEPRDLGQMLGVGSRRASHGSSALVSVLPATTLAATLALAEPSLRVQVTRAGEPVSRALVSYCTAEEAPDLLTAMAIGLSVASTTDDGGWTTLILPGPGDYLVKVRSALMSPLTTRSCRVGKDTETLVVELEAGVVSGACISKAGEPVKRAQVNLIPAPEGGDSGTLLLSLNSPVRQPDDSPGKALRVHLGETTTFADLYGGFRFDDVPAGVYHLEVAHPSFATWSSDPFTLTRDAVVDLGELALEPSCSLHGRIHYGPWADSAREHPVIVRLLTREREPAGMFTAAEDGRFEFTSLSPGHYQLSVEGFDFSHSGEVFEIAPEKANYHSINISN
jgi:protocatechuate 3,4-dioxygenase beta subunit